MTSILKVTLTAVQKIACKRQAYVRDTVYEADTGSTRELWKAELISVAQALPYKVLGHWAKPGIFCQRAREPWGN